MKIVVFFSVAIGTPWRKDGGEAFGQERLAGARWTDHQELMTTHQTII
jgi:hypothetical protein